MKVLMVLTSHDRLGDTGEKTGFWLEELAAPYYVLKDAGHSVTLASPRGGRPPLDPTSDKPENQTASTRRFDADAEAQAALADTVPLAAVDAGDYDGIFYPGGHGPLWDLVGDPHSKALIAGTIAAGRPVALVCHAPAVLKDVTGEDGAPLVAGRAVTGFANAEEEAVGLTAVVPFLLEDELRRLGATFTSAAPFEAHVVADGLLITGQNPASSAPAAEALIAAMTRRIAAEAEAG
jgi:putative intracellular protease/amidase